MPLVDGAASLVIDADGSVTVGAWGSDVTMSPGVVAVRQNLVPLVEGGRPTAAGDRADWQAWGNTCGAASCAPSVPGVEYQWRSGVGVTAHGALVYAAGPVPQSRPAGRRCWWRRGWCAAWSSTSTRTGPPSSPTTPQPGRRPPRPTGPASARPVSRGRPPSSRPRGPATSSPCRRARRLRPRSGTAGRLRAEWRRARPGPLLRRGQDGAGDRGDPRHRPDDRRGARRRRRHRLHLVAQGRRLRRGRRRAVGERDLCSGCRPTWPPKTGAAAWPRSWRVGIGSLDILVNNAGATWGAPLEEFDEAAFERVLALNVKGVFHLTKFLVPLLRRREPRRTRPG